MVVSARRRVEFGGRKCLDGGCPGKGEEGDEGDEVGHKFISKYTDQNLL